MCLLDAFCSIIRYDVMLVQNRFKCTFFVGIARETAPSCRMRRLRLRPPLHPRSRYAFRPSQPRNRCHCHDPAPMACCLKHSKLLSGAFRASPRSRRIRGITAAKLRFGVCRRWRASRWCRGGNRLWPESKKTPRHQRASVRCRRNRCCSGICSRRRHCRRWR